MVEKHEGKANFCVILLTFCASEEDFYLAFSTVSTCRSLGVTAQDREDFRDQCSPRSFATPKITGRTNSLEFEDDLSYPPHRNGIDRRQPKRLRKHQSSGSSWSAGHE